MWKSSLDAGAHLNALPYASQVCGLYALSVFWRNILYSEDYKASADWNSIVTLTPYGEETLAELRPLLGDIKDEDVLLAYFARFFHHDLFIDSQKTDLTGIRQILERELFQERVRLPYRFGRLLYDRFNETYLDTRTDHLMSPEAIRLLQGTPSGVYQVGRLLSGPLGIVDSQDTRYMPPSLNLHLWHCSDTGCNSLHEVTLVEPQSVPVVDASSRIMNALFDRVGPRSEWHVPLVAHLRGGRERRRHVDLQAMIADCVIGRERNALLELAMVGPYGEVLRAVLALPPRRKRDAEGPPVEIVSTPGP